MQGELMNAMENVTPYPRAGRGDCTECVIVCLFLLAGNGVGNNSRRGSMRDQYHWRDEWASSDSAWLSLGDEERNVDEDECWQGGRGGCC